MDEVDEVFAHRGPVYPVNIVAVLGVGVFRLAKSSLESSQEGRFINDIKVSRMLQHNPSID